MSRYWIAVASREHVMRGIAGGFAQVCHGKTGPLNRMAPGDWIVYYSPTEKFGETVPCRQFTAIGTIDAGEAYQFQISEDFIPWRRNVTFVDAEEIPIEPLIDKLTFIHDKKRWGFPFRRGCFEISVHDFQLIATQMGVVIDAQ
jgi:hypothetical protein